MSVITTLKIIICGDSYEELVSISDSRISEFFNIELESVRKKFNYEINVAEDIDSEEDCVYQAEVVVRGRDV
jgi:hypothetical protein